MKIVNKSLVLLIAATIIISTNAGVYAQTPSAGNKTRQRFATRNPEPAKNVTDNSQDPQENSAKKNVDAATKKSVNLKKGETAAASGSSDSSATIEPTGGANVDQSAAVATSSITPSDVPSDTQANRHELASEEAAVIPYYNNFFNTYRLGPEDIISVSVFGQDRYSRSGIIVPPSGRISLALIPGGVFVNGKTVDEVSDAIKKRYDEYIIDPQVSVSLDKASSYRYSVIGDVTQPGIRLMNRRLTVTEALGEAGGVLPTGDRTKVVVLRRKADGNLTPIPVNVSAIYKGKAPDVTYLVPGDQIIVPGNKFKSLQKIMTFFPILSFARIFTGGVFP
jgi:polysaccharide export outer membrane protein